MYFKLGSVLNNEELSKTGGSRWALLSVGEKVMPTRQGGVFEL